MDDPTPINKPTPLSKVIGWWTRRREPIFPELAYPQLDKRVPVEIYPQSAPLPVPYTSFWNVGRDAEHAWPMQRLHQELAISEWLSVQGWPFLPGMKAEPSSLVLTQPNGWFNPQTTRSNIEAPAQTSLGMLSTIKAKTPEVISIDYAKLV